MERMINYMSRRASTLVLSATVCVASAGCLGEEPDWEIGPQVEDSVEIASQGQAMLPIVIGEDPDPALELAAEELADYLEQISGATFEIERSSHAYGIVLGEPEDFDLLPMVDVEFDDGPFDLEDYVIRSTDDDLYLLGASPLAVRFAVWDLLYRFGHRQFFPTDTWEVVPEQEELAVRIDVREEPDWYSRQAPRGAMRMDHRPWAYENWINWQMRNRTTPTFSLSTGHVYDTVIANNQSAFDANDEYWGLVDGEHTEDAQPNVANGDVRQMFVDHALEQFESDPYRQSVAMDPRDGYYWSEDTESQSIGGPSEQAVDIANEVAEAVVQEFGDDKFVGMYGYSHHSPPPQIDVHPNVIVSLATAYIRGGYTFEDMLDGWSERANMIGIREYYGLWEWDYSLPGYGPNAADTEYLRETIPYFHERGARFINAESNDTWGAYGLGYYLASRMLWDVDEAQRMDELIEDFLDKSFGVAKEPMAQFYELIDGSATDPHDPNRPRPLSDDMVGRMYRLLDEARQLAGDDDQVTARIDDLILYTHYVELYRRFDAIDGPQRQEAFDELVSFAWRMRDTMMAESVELTRYINREVRTDDHLEWGSGYDSNGPADRHRTQEDEPFSDSEIVQILEEGIAGHELLELDIEHWEDSGELIDTSFEADDRGGPVGNVNRGDVEAVMATDDGTLPALTISAGHIYADRGPVQWSLRDESGEVIDHGEVVPNEEEHHFELNASSGGVYRFSIENTGQGFVWDYDARGARTTLLAGGRHELRQNWYDRLYFYVPPGKDAIYMAGNLIEDRYEFVDGAGTPVDAGDVEVIQDYLRVPVPQGQDGQVWSIEMSALRPELRFLNIPGYLAFSPDELLLPQEMVGGL